MNNFDQSSTGVNLELHCFYDSCVARQEFEEAFKVLQYSGHRTVFTVLFCDFGGDCETDFDFNDLSNYAVEELTSKEIFKAFYDLNYSSNIDHDLNCGYLSNIKELLAQLECENLGKVHQSILLKEIETYLGCNQSFRDFLQNTFECNYLTFHSRGHTQGDYAKIIVPKSVYKNYMQNGDSSLSSVEAFKKSFELSTFDNLLWNQPIYCKLNIEIDGHREEFYFDEYVKDLYNYDVDEIIEIFEKYYTRDHKEYIKDWLTNNLPAYPEFR
tara:strand:+ start:649 stop:1458 length:810 start_codon:yes stop_codon:yes gene_type:complete